MSSVGSIKGKWCIVTGGGRGIGRAIAEAFASEGANIIITARSTDQLEDAAKALQAKGAPEVVALPADLSSGEGVDKLAADALEKSGGKIYILVNNAGTGSPEDQSPITGDPDAWDKAVQLNVLAPLRLTRRLAPAMAEDKSGIIINICSVSSITPSAKNAVYSTTKYALRGWTLSCYEALRTEGIKVVGIYPGMVETDMTESAAEKGADPEKMIRPEDIAEAAMLAVRTSNTAVPAEIVVRPLAPVFGK
jgi:short-subunit dehydrogenase